MSVYANVRRCSNTCSFVSQTRVGWPSAEQSQGPTYLGLLTMLDHPHSFPAVDGVPGTTVLVPHIQKVKLMIFTSSFLSFVAYRVGCNAAGSGWVTNVATCGLHFELYVSSLSSLRVFLHTAEPSAQCVPSVSPPIHANATRGHPLDRGFVFWCVKRGEICGTMLIELLPAIR